MHRLEIKSQRLSVRELPSTKPWSATIFATNSLCKLALGISELLLCQLWSDSNSVAMVESKQTSDARPYL